MKQEAGLQLVLLGYLCHIYFLFATETAIVSYIIWSPVQWKRRIFIFNSQVACAFNEKSSAALLTSLPRGHCILPFHCSMVCSLSSSCLSEIWGGGYDTNRKIYIKAKSHTSKSRPTELPHMEQSPHRIGLCWIVPHVNVGVIEGFFYRDAAFRINDQHFGQQVPRLTCCYGNRGTTSLLWK